MNRREFLERIPAGMVCAVSMAAFLGSGMRIAGAEIAAGGGGNSGVPKDWLGRWEKNILGDARSSRYCDKEMGEELGWLVSPFLDGFYQGWRATRDSKWVELLADWTDACLRRGVKEPDGFIGWPKTTTDNAQGRDFHSDSLLGEAMWLRPVVLMAGEILQAPALAEKWGGAAREWLEFSGRIFEKWDARGCWREVKAGGLWVVPPFGIDQKSGGWTDGYARRKTDGFSNPANKQNHIARWLLAMAGVTKQPVYRERAEKWWRLMRSRMTTREQGKYFVWNYWDPAGPWDYRADGTMRHWVGVHPNGGYYAIDVEGMVSAFDQGLVFSRDDIDRLIATNRDYMWNQKLPAAKFQRIDGGPSDSRWPDAPGVLWTALVPRDETLRRIFVATNNPAGWGGMGVTPWFVALATGR